MATFIVANLNDSGAGSLREAIELANFSAGVDVITFAAGLSGTITLDSALPEISDPVTINALALGQSAPRIQIDFAGNPGITFGEGSGRSSLIGFSLVRASGDALTLVSSNNTIQNNYIGVHLDGSTVIENQGNGITITSASTGNLIGSTTPGSSTDFNNLGQEPGYDIDAIQGIRYGITAGDYILCGSGSVQGGSGQGIGVVFVGAPDGSGANWYTVNAATAFGDGINAITSCYGPEQLDANTIRVVGSYNPDGAIPPTDTYGFIYTGPITAADGTTSGFVEYKYPGSTWTFFHSTQEGLVVGNWDNTATIPDTSKPIIGVGKAFIYDVGTGTSIADVRYPGSDSTTAYGIAKVNDNLFAITGSYSLSGKGNNTGHGYLVYYHRDTNTFSDWLSWDINNDSTGNFFSHADGISYNNVDNTFTLATVALQAADGNEPISGYLMTVDRKADGGFGELRWTEVNYQGQSEGGVTIPTSVAGDVMTGVYVGTGSTTWSSDTTFYVNPSNVISGNAANGVAVLGSKTVADINNTIAQNRIGTSADGTTALSNGGNGILIDGGSRNLIGGAISGGNDPTKDTTTPPPLGNLISGNLGNGVLIRNGATDNTLSGNFIGTTKTGNQKLGNAGDGVAIVNANNNQLVGCQLESSPFVYYNVVSGNLGNGLRIKDSNNTTIHANFFGLAANNQTPLGNGGNGALIEGNSANTQYGGVIPLGNVNSGNGLNGIEVKDTVNGFITFNTFAGTTAFGGIAPNQLNGMLFTSSGGNNTIRTNVVGGNLGNGIHITGSAAGITVDPNIIGLNSYGTETTYTYPSGQVVSFANGLDGIRVDGDAQDISIAGAYRSVIPQNTISNNNGYGIRVDGNARNVQISNTAVGTGSEILEFDKKFGNQLGGIFVGGNSNAVTLGDASGSTGLLVANNAGDGLVIDGRLNNQITNAVFRENAGYGVSFLGINKIQADKQINSGLSYVDNGFGALQVAPGWANLSLSRAVGSDRFTVAANTSISLMRLDTSSQAVSFGVESQSTGTKLPLTQLGSANAQSLDLQKIFAGTWATTEGVALGGRQATAISADTWIPIASDQDGNRLKLEGLTLAGNSATATFAGGIQAVYSVGGSGVLASAASDGPVATVTATVRRLGRYNNGLAIYEADALTGAVNGLLPGNAGYLQAALQSAKQAGRVFSASQLPGYGQSSSLNLSLSTEKNYGFLLLVDGSESNLYSSYNAANPGSSVQFTSFTTPDGGLTIGIEDLLISGASDQDFNDIILSISPAASQAERTLVSPFYYTGSGASTSKYGLQGIKGADTAASYYIVGTSGINGVVYNGPIDQTSTSDGSGSGRWTVMNVPTSFNATATSIYGVDNLDGANVTLVGSYDPPSSTKAQNSFYYLGPVTATSSAANWKSFQATGSQGDATYTILHSVDEGLAVGNYDYASMDVGEGTWRGNAFIYDPAGNGGAGQQLDITYPIGAGSHTAYGIWYNGIVNGRKNYTIAGGEAFQFGSSGPANASLIDFDYDPVTGLSSGRFSNFRTFGYVQDDPTAPTTDSILATHFEGIWYDGVSTYRLPATLVSKTGAILGGYAEIERLPSGQFSSIVNWDVFNQGVLGSSSVVTNDSLFRGASVGAMQSSNALNYALV